MTDAPAISSANLSAPVGRVRWGGVLTFYLLACGLAWAVDLPLWISGRGLATPFAAVFLVASMYTPGLAALLVVVFVQRTPRARILSRLGWWPIRPVTRTILFAVAGLTGSALLPIVTVFVAAAFGFIQLDLIHFSGFAQTVSSQLPAGQRLPLPIQVLVVIQLAEIPVGALLNSFSTVGEETGWRGFLLPALRPLGTWPALVISGALWGLWHAPIILLGYNFNRPNALGLGLMIVGSAAFGTLLGWLRIRSRNIWPSVIGHGAFNAAGGFAAIVAAAGSTADPAVVGPLGWIAWILVAVVMIVLALTRQVPPRGAWGDPPVPPAPPAPPSHYDPQPVPSR